MGENGVSCGFVDVVMVFDVVFLVLLDELV